MWRSFLLSDSACRSILAFVRFSPLQQKNSQPKVKKESARAVQVMHRTDIPDIEVCRITGELSCASPPVRGLLHGSFSAAGSITRPPATESGHTDITRSYGWDTLIDLWPPSVYHQHLFHGPPMDDFFFFFPLIRQSTPCDHLHGLDDVVGARE